MQKIGLNMTNDAMNTILTSIFKHSQPSTQTLVEIDIRNRINELRDRTNRSTAEDEELSSLIKFSETHGLKTY